MALYRTPLAQAWARGGFRRQRPAPQSGIGRSWATGLASLCLLSLTAGPALAQVSASGTMIAAPAAASAPATHAAESADAAQPKIEHPANNAASRLQMPTHPLVLHPVMPTLPEIPPPRHISVAVTGGGLITPHATAVTPVNLAATPTATASLAANPAVPAGGTGSNAGNTQPISTGQLPPPRIDPSIGDAQQPTPDHAAAKNTAAVQPTPPSAFNAPPASGAGAQSDDAIRASAIQFLRQQTAGLPGQVEIVLSPVAPRGLAACDSLETFLPPGAHLWGRTTVGVRCIGTRPWTLYVQARIAVNATYFVAANEIAPGQEIAATDLTPRQGDLTNLPRSVVTDLSQIVGKSSLERISQGSLLRQDMARAIAVVQAGQAVKLTVQGSGFSISSEGSAMSNAAAGESVKVRTSSGQVVSGVVKDRDTVEIPL